MTQIDLDKAVALVAEAALGAYEERALHICMEIRMEAPDFSLWGFDNEVEPYEAAVRDANKIMDNWKGDDVNDAPWPDPVRVTRSVHFLFRRPATNRQVFACTSDSWSVPKPEAFEFESEHDSCWRDACRLAFDKATRECAAELKALKVPEGARRVTHCGWTSTKWMIAEVERHREVAYGPGRYSVKSIVEVAQ